MGPLSPELIRSKAVMPRRLSEVRGNEELDAYLHSNSPDTLREDAQSIAFARKGHGLSGEDTWRTKRSLAGASVASGDGAMTVADFDVADLGGASSARSRRDLGREMDLGAPYGERDGMTPMPSSPEVGCEGPLDCSPLVATGCHVVDAAECHRMPSMDTDCHAIAIDGATGCRVARVWGCCTGSCLTHSPLLFIRRRYAQRR